jgi:uncharacterized protein YecE (DUF72 family)
MTRLRALGAERMVGEQKANCQGGPYWDRGQKRASGLKESKRAAVCLRPETPDISRGSPARCLSLVRSAEFRVRISLMPKRPKLEPIRDPTLFEMDKLEEAGRLANSLTVERPYFEPGLFLGTSAFTAAGWPGSFYPAGMKASEYLTYYATQFQTVEIDSTYYRTPSASTVTGWYEKTPPDFVFAAKVPQIITHEKILVNCEAEFEEFVDRMDILDEKLGPLLFQFPKFTKYQIQPDEFSRRLRFLLNRVKDLPTVRFAVEIRNKAWLDKRFTDLLREYNVALALTDTSFMPRPWEMKGKVDLVTTDFLYVRWLGDRHGIEKITQVWDKTVVDRKSDLMNWVDVLRAMVLNKQIRKLFAFMNNHYSGHSPAGIKLFWDLWEKK